MTKEERKAECLKYIKKHQERMMTDPDCYVYHDFVYCETMLFTMYLLGALTMREYDKKIEDNLNLYRKREMMEIE